MINYSYLTIARPYAQAAFDFAYERKILEKWELMLFSAKNLIQSKIMVKLLSNINYINPNNLLEVFISIGNHCFDCFFQNFIRIMIEYKRLHLFSFVYEEFLFLRRQQLSIINVKVVVAYILDNDQRKKIISVIERKISRKVNVVFNLDRSIIGGFIIYFNDYVIDASIKGKIMRFKNHIVEL